jgi:hypothetical protein
MDLYQMSQEWSGFFSALAQVSGGLVGLVFVALTFNPKKLGAGGDPMLGELARVTFSDFLVLLMVSLLMLVPHATVSSLGGAFVAVGATGALRILHSLVRLRAHLRPGQVRWGIVPRFILSVLGHLLNVVIGLLLLRGKPDTDVIGSLLVSTVVLLLLSASRSAWLLVTTEAG